MVVKYEITLRECWAQPRTTELKSSGFILLLSILSDFCPFIESKIIQAYLSYNGYTLGQYIFANVNRIYSCEILDMPCVMSGHVSCSVTSSNLSYPGMLCHVSCVMCHMSYVMCHVPCAMSHVSSVMRHASCIMYHILHVMLCHVSCQVMCHVQWSSGLVVQWSSGPVVQWSSSQVVKWSNCPVVQWSSGPVVQ